MQTKKKNRPTANRAATYEQTLRRERARVSIQDFSTTARAVKCESAAQKILSPMLHTARRNGWTRVVNAIVQLWRQWKRRGW